MATVEQRGDSWRVYWRMGGRDGRKQSTTWATHKDALLADSLAKSRSHNITDDEVYRAILGINDTGFDVPTVDQWADDWLKLRRKIGDIQPDTIAGYGRVIDLRIRPRLGKLRLSQLTPDVRAEWIAWLNAQPSRRGGTLGAETVRRAHAVLHSLLGAAVPKWLPSNPIAKPAGSRKRVAGLPKAVRFDAMFLMPDEVARILDNCPDLIRDLVYVDVRTGLRLGELLVLRVGEDADLTGKRKVVRVRRALKQDGSIGAPKSKRSRRDVSISEEVAERLGERAKGKRRGDLLFTAPRSGMWVPSNLHRRFWVPGLAQAQRCLDHLPPLPTKAKTGPRRKWRPDEVSTCDCPVRLHRVPRFHDLRHTHVGLCVEAGWDPVRVQRRLGHESITTTMDIYGHLWESPDVDRLDAVERLLLIADDEEA